MKAYYRFIDQPDDSAVTPSNILLPHREQTIRRMKAEDTVLCIQDGTDLNYNGLDDCTGLGQIGTNQTGATRAGLHLHSTVALTTTGLPLGVLKADFSATAKAEKKKAKALPIEEKKTFCWIEGLRDCMELKAQMPHTRIVNVSDREADFFELFDEQRRQCTRVELRVRAKHNRGTPAHINCLRRSDIHPFGLSSTLPCPDKAPEQKKASRKREQNNPHGWQKSLYATDR